MPLHSVSLLCRTTPAVTSDPTDAVERCLDLIVAGGKAASTRLAGGDSGVFVIEEGEDGGGDTTLLMGGGWRMGGGGDSGEGDGNDGEAATVAGAGEEGAARMGAGVAAALAASLLSDGVRSLFPEMEVEAVLGAAVGGAGLFGAASAVPPDTRRRRLRLPASVSLGLNLFLSRMSS